MKFDIQITASFTAEPLRGPLQFWLRTLGVDAAVTFSAYNQFLQQTLDPQSESARNTSGLNVFLLRLEDLAGQGEVSQIATEIGDAFPALASRSPAAQLVLFCPHPDRTPATTALELTLADRWNLLANTAAFTTEQWSTLYPVADPFDSETEGSAHIPFTGPLFAALATVVARHTSSRLRPPAKVLVLDADNTLWGGVCGEDGPQRLHMGGPWRFLREFAASKRDHGLLLCLCSKNHPADLDRVFAERADDLALTRDHFSGWKVNWNPKSQNIRELAAELNLGLDSFVFLDDNPAEVAEVSAHCPGVLALTLPDLPDSIPAFLRHLWPLDLADPTPEDAARADFYRQESERQILQKSAPTFADFLRSLDLRVKIDTASPEDLPRIAQLTQRTNQFNAHPLRLSESDLARRLSSGSTCLAVYVSDRFGDYGLVGAMLLSPQTVSGTLPVDLFLLSCRAMGKGVERSMVIELGTRARALGSNSLEIAFSESDRNEPCLRFFEEIGAARGGVESPFTLSAAAAADLAPLPQDSHQPPPPPASSSTPPQARRPLFDADLALRIATEWSDPIRLHAALGTALRERPDLSQALVKPESPTEVMLAEIWREVLAIKDIGLHDPFSALGGGSIELVRLHAAIRRKFGSAIELAEMFALPTIAALAARIGGKDSSPALPLSLPQPAAHTPAGNADDQAIAIIGMALRVPGANDPDTFWQNLTAGVESITHFQRDEIEIPEDYDKPGYVPSKGLMDGVDLFDASFFGILPKDARIMDPQQRIFLELAWEAMERSGYTPETHRQRIGVYAGAYFDSYLLANLCTDRAFLADLIPSIQVGSLQTELGNDKDYLATRVAFKMNLRGPAMSLQTACSTSMVAVVEACRAIRSGLCDMALAGGITVTLPLKRGYFYTQEGMLSGDGHCRAFDERASGTVFGNGAGVVMLKRLSDALRDRDHIHAVIKGTALNNDGGIKHSYTAPSVEGQVDVIRMAHRDAGIDPQTIGYIEAHGTGTPLGDPIEVTALTKAFRASGVTGNGFCALGSLKTNIGHLDVASGVCGLIKTALSLEHGQLPPILHYQNPNPKIDFSNSPFFVNASLSPWKSGIAGHPRRAGVSSFGVGGTNAHVVVEEAPAADSAPSPRRTQLFLLSARTAESLAATSANIAAFASHPGSTTPADAAWTLAVGRKPFRCRRAVAAEDFAHLASSLASDSGVSGIADRSNPPVHFLFPGQGTQHVNMGRAIYDSEPRFRHTVDHCSEILRPLLGLTLTDVLYPPDGADLDAPADLLKHTVLAQPAIFVIGYALADLWLHWGVKPAAMLGHSVGEFVAACHAGVFDLESGLRLLAARGRLMGDLPAGGMLSVRLSEADLLARLPDSLDLAAVNGPALCVVSGPRDALKDFSEVLGASGVVSQILHTSHAFHSRMMDPAVALFAAEFDGVPLSAPKIPILSTVTGTYLSEQETGDPLYWAKHLREPVRFHRSVVTLGADNPGQIFVEVGPGQTLTGLVRQSLDRKSGHLAVSTCRHVKEAGCDHANLLESLGKLWASGVEVDWDAFYVAELRQRVVLPTYPFERKRHWVDPTPLDFPSSATPAPALRSPSPPASDPLPAAARQEPVQIEPAMSTPQSPSRRDSLAGAIRAVLTDLSGIPDEELAGDASFLEQGFDSLLLTQVSKALQNEFKTEITLRHLMGELSSIDAMVDHLDAALPADRYRPSLPPPPTPAPLPIASPAPAAPAAPSPATIAPLALPSAPALLPTSASVIESVIAQQLDLMRHQIALLQTGGSQVPPPIPVPTIPAPAPAPAPATPQQVSAPIPAPAKTSSSDVSAPTTSINRSLDDQLTDRQRRHLDTLIADYVGKTRRSKELTAHYRRWHADPRTVSGFNRRWKEMIYQIAVTKSKGSRLIDVDGNEYIDLLNGFGPNFLGHSPDFVTEALHAQLDRGVEVGPQCVNAMEAAQLFCEITGNERASFVNTGSEAVQAAMRLARTVTGRDKIVVFTKDYHGNFDEMLVKGVGSGDNLRSLPIAPGIPRRAVEDVIVLPYGSDEALATIRSRAHELAAVIVEPIQSRRPEFQPADFIREVREITRQSGTLFVFDEVITGFRTGPRGAQEFYGVEADLATYGKVVGGGMPLGVVAGKAEFMDTFDGGMWHYGDDSFPEKGVTFFAGTFVRHPLAMAAVKEVLLHLKSKGPDFWQGIRDRANRLAGTIDKMFLENGAPIRMPNFGSQMFIRVAEDHKYANLFFFHLRNKGVFLLEGFPTYMTAAHTDEDIDYVIAAFRESLAEMQDGGFFDTPSGTVIPTLNGSRLTGPPRLISKAVEPASPEAPTPDTKKNATPQEPRLYPMTEPLAEVWLASQIGENASLCFHEINLLTLRGHLHTPSLQAALQDLVDRHDALRSVFPNSGDGFLIRPLNIALPLVDLTAPAHTDSSEALNALLDQERTTPFDLENGPLFRASLIRLKPAEHVLVLNAHHLACDGWSYNTLLREFGDFYNARTAGRTLPADPPPTFGDFAIREVARDSAADESFWLNQFSEPAQPLKLPTDFPAPPEPDFRCASVGQWLPPETVNALKRAAGRSGATLFGLLMGAYEILLHRISRQQRFVIGFPSAGQKEPGYEGLVGHCVNFLPFIAQIDPGTPVSEFLKNTQSRLLDAIDHHRFTYGQLIKKFPPHARPTIEAVFNYERMDESLAMDGLETSVRELERHFAGNPLFLKSCETASGIELRLDFQSSLFAPDTVHQWLTTYRAILDAILANPNSPVREIASALAPEQRDLLLAWNRTSTPYPDASTVPALFEEIVQRDGQRTALHFESGTMSYAELGHLTGQFAQCLLEAGAAPGSRVALFLDRSPDLIAAMFAVMQTGAAYVPLDPEYPSDRLRFMLEDSGASLVITRKKSADRLPKELHIRPIFVEQATKKSSPAKRASLPPVAADDAAYVIYTSGSTGTPKGTVVPHRGIVRLVRNTGYCTFGENETILQASTSCFDASVYEIYGALLNGGTLLLPPPGPLTVDSIARSIRDGGVTQLFLTTGLFQVMIDEAPDAFAGARQVLTGGDLVSVDHMARFLAAHPACRLIHCYGPTENTTFSTCHAVSSDDLGKSTIPIGRPIANSTAWILDAHGHLQAPCIPGELHTGGDGVALGYLGNPDLTSEKFAPDPFSTRPHARLYRTGDLARYRPDGTIEFLGRLDHQVKIRGFRVEPGEIEARLARHPRVRQCKVVVRGTSASDKSLAAYVSPINGVKPTQDELLGYLRSKLPVYLVPSSIVVMDDLPLNANGKIDSHALPDPLIADPPTNLAPLPPTATETTLAAIWKDVLRAGDIGLDDDFFTIGGHSLLGMKLLVRIQKAFGVPLPLAVLFQAPSIRQLAAVIDAKSPPADGSPPADSPASAHGDTSPHPTRGIFLNGSTDAPDNQKSPIAETTVAIQPKGNHLPLFAVHGGDGGVLFYGKLSEHLGDEFPFFAFEAPALTATGPIPEHSIAETATLYISELQKVQPAGPYHLCGYSFGGVVAYEMACQLAEQGKEIGFLGLIDTENPAAEARRLTLGERVAANWNDRSRTEAGVFKKMGELGKRVSSGLAYRIYFEAENALASSLPKAKRAGWLRQVQLRKAHERAMQAYVPREFPGNLTLFRATMGGDKFDLGYGYGWDPLVRGGLDVIDIPGNHISLFHPENLASFSDAFRHALSAAFSSKA